MTDTQDPERLDGWTKRMLEQPGLREAAQAVVDLWDDDDINPADGAWKAANDAFAALDAALATPAPPRIDVERLARALADEWPHDLGMLAAATRVAKAYEEDAR